jgi:hypothetical protein
VTPYVIDAIAVGDHAIGFQHRGYISYERVFTVVRDQHFKMTVILAPGWPLYAAAKSNYGSGESKPKVSYDMGDTWEELGRGQIIGDVRAIGVDPNHSQTLYASVHGAGPQLYRSTDGGVMWEGLTLPVSRPSATDIEVIPGNSSIVYVTISTFEYGGTFYSGAGGIFRTTNGQTFGTASGGSLPPYADTGYFMGVHDIAFYPLDYQRAVVGVRAFVKGWSICHTANGTYWSASQMDPPIDTPFDAYSLCFDPVDVDLVWAATSKGLYRSVDVGVNFSLYYDTPCQAVAVDPSDHFRIYLGTGKTVQRSEDGGLTWSDLAGYTAPLAVSSIIIDARDPSRVYVGLYNFGPDGSIARYVDGVGWNQVLHGPLNDLTASTSRSVN